MRIELVFMICSNVNSDIFCSLFSSLFSLFRTDNTLGEEKRVDCVDVGRNLPQKYDLLRYWRVFHFMT